MTKTLTIALNVIENQVLAAAMINFTQASTEFLPDIQDDLGMMLKTTKAVVRAEKFRLMFEEKAESIELKANEAAFLVSTLQLFEATTQQKLVKVAEEGDIRMLVGGLQALAVAQKIIATICEGGERLAQEEEAEALRKAA